MPDAQALTTLLFLGLLLGMKHALEADHVAAVAALATRSRSLRHTVWQGVVWGAGHTLTLLFFGSVALVMNAAVPHRLAQWLELAVGAMLVLLGLDVLRRLRRDRVHFHVHRHPDDGIVHFHAHAHARDGHAHEAAHHPHPHRESFPLRALFVGMMHGMAGTAALLLVTVSAAPSAALGIAQILAFGAGSICGMAALSVAIAVPLRLSGTTLNWTHRALQSLVGLASVTLGGTIMYSIGVSGVLLC